jgi:hypothetical protein
MWSRLLFGPADSSRAKELKGIKMFFSYFEYLVFNTQLNSEQIFYFD